MEKYLPIVYKFVRTLLLFAIFKIALDWWRIGFGSLIGVLHNYPDILAEAFCFAIVWMLVTKIWRWKTVPERE